MINQIGPVPSPLDSQAVFNDKAFTLLAQLPGFVDETNQTAQTMQINADVAAALILAMALPQFAGTSTSSVTVGTGTRTFTTQAGKGWLPGQIVVASSGASYVKGTVTDYTGTDLELNVTSINGSGTYAAWNIGLSYDGLALAGSGDNDNILRLLGLVEVPAVIAAALLAAYVPQVPQTVLSGPVDSNGFSAFGGTTGTATLTTAGTLRATCFAGSALHRVGNIVNPAFTSPGGAGTAYPYLEISAAGVVTTGVSSLQWIYQHGGTPSVTNGQHTVNTQEGKVYVGNGTVATQVYRVCIGECPHTSGAWSGSPIWYAIKGVYDSGWTATLPSVGTAISKNHNIGSAEVVSKLIFDCTTADHNYSVGDRITEIETNSGTNLIAQAIWTTNKSTGFTTGSSSTYYSINKVNGGGGLLTAASWKYKIVTARVAGGV